MKEVKHLFGKKRLQWETPTPTMVRRDRVWVRTILKKDSIFVRMQFSNGLEVCWCLLCSYRTNSSSLLFFVSVLDNLSALPDFKHWMVENLASQCLEGDIGRGLFLICCIFLLLLSLLEENQLCLFCSPCSSTIGNAACARSKPHSVCKPPYNPPLPQQHCRLRTSEWRCY